MIKTDMIKKEEMLRIAEAAIENKSKIEPGFTTTESLIKQWLSEVFDYAYSLGENSGLRIAVNSIEETKRGLKDILKRDPQ
jgi:hypothetical protein